MQSACHFNWSVSHKTKIYKESSSGRLLSRLLPINTFATHKIQANRNCKTYARNILEDAMPDQKPDEKPQVPET